MKRFAMLLLAGLLGIAPGVRAQDSATAAAIAERQIAEERYKRLNSAVEDMLAAQSEMQRRLTALSRELDSLRDAQSRPNTSYANQDDLRKLAEKVQEIDRKREADKELILKEISKLGKTIAAAPAPAPARTSPSVTSAAPAPSAGPQKGYEYIIQPGDTLSTIAEAYRVQGVKVSVDEVLKANPKVDARRLQVGQKIFIPEP